MRPKDRKKPKGETRRKAERKLHQLRRRVMQNFANQVFAAAQNKVPVGDGTLKIGSELDKSGQNFGITFKKKFAKGGLAKILGV